MYSLLRPLLFALDPETAHAIAFKSLDLAAGCGLAQRCANAVADDPVEVMGLRFKNRVGLAAGLDKNAAHLDGLAALGFGFIECGTVTPRPQSGNPKPRLFRLAQDQALINRLGFNNDGVERFVANMEDARYRGILGANIGKNFDTPNERAVDDYIACFSAVYARASYVTVNVSSPNTQGLRELQESTTLAALLERLKAMQLRLADEHGKYTPLVVKIAPDLDQAAIDALARVLIDARIDAVIATNTTIARDGITASTHGDEVGGLSGQPLARRATAVVQRLARTLDGALPIIGVGGILSGDDAREKISAGATLVQLYTGLIYRGPSLVTEVGQALRSL